MEEERRNGRWAAVQLAGADADSRRDALCGARDGTTREAPMAGPRSARHAPAVRPERCAPSMSHVSHRYLNSAS